MLTNVERAALERLIEITKYDTGQSRKVSDFLLSWWNADECGGLKITDFWWCDANIEKDMVTAFLLAVRSRSYPCTLGYNKEFTAMARAWRP